MEGTKHCGYTDRLGMSRVADDWKAWLKPSEEEPNMLRVEVSKSREPHIGIVGAGFAGLRCADVLLQHGYEVTIFEARNRIGGRVAQSDHLGHKVDLGPNVSVPTIATKLFVYWLIMLFDKWIHGSKNNPIMKLARETDTKLKDWDDKATIYDSEGKLLCDKETHLFNQLLWDEGVIHKAFRHSNKNHDTLDPFRSLYDYMVEKAYKRFPKFTGSLGEFTDRRRETFLQFCEVWGLYIGSPVSRQSLKYLWLEECIEGEDPFVAGTYHKILGRVAEPALQGAEIRLETEVVKVHAGKVLPGFDEEGDYPRIVTAAGEMLSFDEVVVTTPLGFLKNNKDLFEPRLPARLLLAIDEGSYGILDKVYITFPWPFWYPSSDYKPPSDDDSTSDEEPLQGKMPKLTIKAPSPNAIPESEPEDETESHAGFINWLRPKYAESTNPEQWLQDALNLAALPSECAHPTLLFYMQGAQSKHIAQLVASAKDDQDRDAKLISFFKPYYSRLPNYDEEDPKCTPEAVLATAWANDRFAGYGSYSNFQVGLENGAEHIETMRHGMPERRIWLAGEHTAPFVALGTSTGAYMSGQKVGERIVGLYDRPKAEDSDS